MIRHRMRHRKDIENLIYVFTISMGQNIYSIYFYSEEVRRNRRNTRGSLDRYHELKIERFSVCENSISKSQVTEQKAKMKQRQTQKKMKRTTKEVPKNLPEKKRLKVKRDTENEKENINSQN